MHNIHSSYDCNSSRAAHSKPASVNGPRETRHAKVRQLQAARFRLALAVQQPLETLGRGNLSVPPARSEITWPNGQAILSAEKLISFISFQIWRAVTFDSAFQMNRNTTATNITFTRLTNLKENACASAECCPHCALSGLHHLQPSTVEIGEARPPAKERWPQCDHPNLGVNEHPHY
jgi:hypothetical protein